MEKLKFKALLIIASIVLLFAALSFYEKTGYWWFFLKSKHEGNTQAQAYSDDGLVSPKPPAGAPEKIDGLRVIGTCGRGIFGNCFKGQECNNLGGICGKDPKSGGCYCLDQPVSYTPE